MSAFNNNDLSTELPDTFFRDALDGLTEAIYFVDRDRRIVFWNRSAERLTGIPASEIVGRRCCESPLHHAPGTGTALCDGECPLTAAMGEGKPREEDLELQHRDGRRIPVRTWVSPIRDRSGTIRGAIEVFRDISEVLAQQERTARLERAAMLDVLTGIPNRRHLESALHGRLEEMERYGWPFGVLFVDIDRFKEVNDTLGHEVGDRVLRMVARTLSADQRSFDLLGRWGGEEFLVILTNVTDEGLWSIAERSRIRVQESSAGLEDGQSVSVTVSIGGTMAEKGDTLESLVRRADRRMYLSKSAGRNRVTVLAAPDDSP